MNKDIIFSSRECNEYQKKGGSIAFDINQETKKNSNATSIDNTINNEMKCFRDLNNKLTSILGKLDVSNINPDLSDKEKYEQSGFCEISEYA